MTETIRTRFAPSPTGNLHVGGARTALFCWLFSRHHDGDFILRVEDTDFDRSADQYTEQILSAMKWLGMEWDEGPEVGGPHEPYFQSERIDRYEEVLEKLKEQGKAYRCYCTKKELEQERERQRARKEPPRYSGRCRDLSEEKRQEFEQEGRQHTWRYRIPNEPVVVHDLAKGDVSFPADQVGDFIIVKSNGSPSYNFAVVVDDHEMEISHVVRGDDHLSNTPRQLYLYDAMDWEPPLWCHLPMILGHDGERLSKRHGATNVEDYRRKGYLPEALLNGLALLGWSPPDGVEVKKIDELIEVFTLDRVNKSASRFDLDKVQHINGQHLRDLPVEELVNRLQPFLPNSMKPEDQDSIEEIIEVLRDQLTLLTDFEELYEQFIREPIEVSDEAIEWLKEHEGSEEVARSFHEEIEQAEGFTLEHVKGIIGDTSEQVKASGRELYLPMRILVTGQLEGPEFHELMPVIGKERCLERIRHVLDEWEVLQNV